MKIGAVGGKPGELFRSHAGAEFTAFQGRAEQQNVRFVFFDQVNQDLGIRQHGKRFQAFVFRQENGIAAVMIKRVNAFADIVTQQNGFGFDSETFGKFAAFTHELKADISDSAAFLLYKYPYISNFFRHINHPSV